MRKLTPPALISTFAILFLPTSACKKKGEIQHYRVAKTSPAETPSPTTALQPSTPQTQTPAYNWTLPEGWSAQAASGMRLATIIIPSESGELQASLTEFGGDLAGNVNRWRGQIGLDPLPADQVLPSLETVQTGLGPGYITTLIHPDKPEQAMLAAIIPRPSGTSVFVKVTAPASSLQAIADNFRQFTQSLKK